MTTTALERKISASLDSRRHRSILRRVDQPHSPSEDHDHPVATPLIDFSSNDYLSLSTNPTLRSNFLQKLAESDRALGSGGSRLLDGNTLQHFALETRLKRFFDAPAALLFNSGFDANVSLFSTLPQPGDAILLDEYVHASVWDGCRASRASKDISTFKHNSIESLSGLLTNLTSRTEALRTGESSVFVAVESLYSMDGDFAPLRSILDLVDELLPNGNGHIIVDEAHTTGIYGPSGRGLVAMLGLESRVSVRLHTFGKALASNGAVVMCSPLIRSYLCNYARPLIFSTAMNHSNVVSIHCSFDLLENATAEKLARHLLTLSHYFLSRLTRNIAHVPKDVLSLPAAITEAAVASYPDDGYQHHHPPLISPIIPLLTRNARPLAAHLQHRGFLARAITHPTVPKDQDRVRLCLHSGNTREQVDHLIEAVMEWVRSQQIGTQMQQQASMRSRLIGLTMAKL